MLREIKDQPTSTTPMVLNSTVTSGSNFLHDKKKPIMTHNSLYATKKAGTSVSMPDLYDAVNHKEQKNLEKNPNSPPSAWKDVENSNSLKPSSLQKLNKSTEHSKGQATPT